MGNCQSDSSHLEKQNAEINRKIQRDRSQNQAIVKLLLLGAAESGKSTLLKQIKIIHDNGYPEDEAIKCKGVIIANLIQSMGSILTGLHELCIDNARLIQGLLTQHKELGPLTSDVYNAIKELWADEAVQTAFQRKNEFYMNDSAKYFLDAMDRIYEKQYIPSTEDILHSRVPTMGVVEVTFHIKERVWKVFDVGGQRSQRKKWIHCFDDVTAIIFLAVLSEFDQVLQEDSSTNRMCESLLLFKQICNIKFFVETNIILFLNKKDIFIEKVAQGRNLRIAFPEYAGPDTDEAYARYIEKRFLSVNENRRKIIYCHHTCATDTKQLQFILDSVIDTILSGNLKSCGLY